MKPSFKHIFSFILFQHLYYFLFFNIDYDCMMTIILSDYFILTTEQFTVHSSFIMYFYLRFILSLFINLELIFIFYFSLGMLILHTLFYEQFDDENWMDDDG